MYFTYTVPIPQIKGKILTKKKADAIYVLYQYGQKYNPEKKYAIPQRAIIGKLDPANHQNMYPNDKFQNYFPNVELPDELPESSRSCALNIGSYTIIKKVLNEYAIPEILAKWFPKDSGLLMDFMSYLLINEDNAGQYYPDFAYNHPLFTKNMRIFSDSKVCRLLKSVTNEQIMGFLADWNAKRDHRQRIYISYDSTNKNCQAGDISLIEYGKAKDNKGLPVYNLALAFDKTNRIPLFYEVYPGSITDVSQFSYMVDKVKSYKYKRIGFILDRGYFSRDNIKYMEDNGYSFIMMVKGRKALVAELIKEHQHTFEIDQECSIRAYRTYGKTIFAKLYDDDTKDRYFHLFYNPSRQAAEREQLEKIVEKMALFIEKHVGQAIKLPKTYHEYFDLHYNKENILAGYCRRNKDIQQKLSLCGYFCIITSEKMTAAEALIHYKGRDVSEKLFSADKSFIGSNSARVQTADALQAKLFIEFLALIVRNRMYNLLKEAMMRMDAKANYMNVPAAIRELEKIEMVRRTNNRYYLDHAITKKQRTILSSFGVDDAYVKKEAAAISDLLFDNRCVLEQAEHEKSNLDEEVFDYVEDEIDNFDSE